MRLEANTAGRYRRKEVKLREMRQTAMKRMTKEGTAGGGAEKRGNETGSEWGRRERGEPDDQEQLDCLVPGQM